MLLPAAGAGRIADKRLRYWLARADLIAQSFAGPPLATVLAELGVTPPSGQAALRFWGQTGDRPGSWMAAADPVYLEPRLDHLCLHALDGRVTTAELRRLSDHLQARLGGVPGCGFAQLGPCTYVTALEPFATAAFPASAIDGDRPDAYLPQGEAAAAHRRLASEIEMALHGHAVNVERETGGQPPVNALWLWGGGTAPEKTTTPLPPLFADDPMLHGYWQSCTGVCEPWPGSIAACLEQSVAGFVAVAPEQYDEHDLARLLIELRAALQSARLERLVLWFRDGLRADVRRPHASRFWRLRNTLLESGPGTS